MLRQGGRRAVMIENARERLKTSLSSDIEGTISSWLQGIMSTHGPDTLIARWGMSPAGQPLRARWVGEMAAQVQGLLEELLSAKSPEKQSDATWRAHVFGALQPDTAEQVAMLLADEPDPDIGFWFWMGGWEGELIPESELQRTTLTPDGWEVISHIQQPDGSKWCIVRPTGLPRYLRAFCKDAWSLRWSKLLREAERSAQKPAAIVSLVAAPLARAMGTGKTNKPDTTTVPLIPYADGIVQTIEAVRRIAGQALIRWLIRAGHEAYMAGDDWATMAEEGLAGRKGSIGADLVVTKGGWGRLAELVGLSDKGTIINDLRDAVRILAGHSLAWEYGDREGIGSLISMEGGTERNDPIRITVSPVLLPYAVKRFWPKTALAPRLVPVLPLPPLTRINPKAQAAAARLDWLAVLELAEGGVSEGGVELPWRELAREAGVTTQGLQDALNLWCAPGEDQRWEREGERYRLATKDPILDAAWRFLLAGSDHRKTAVENGGKRAKTRKSGV